MSNKVKKLILDELVSDADAHRGDDSMEYVRGLVDGVAIAQGRSWHGVLDDLLTHARKEGCYEDAVRDMEMIFDGD